MSDVASLFIHNSKMIFAMLGEVVGLLGVGSEYPSRHQSRNGGCVTYCDDTVLSRKKNSIQKKLKLKFYPGVVILLLGRLSSSSYSYIHTPLLEILLCVKKIYKIFFAF